ncbi:MAG: NAD-dependent epimerase/dehydratase family protein [Phycisphaerae bacterium]
MNLVTGATGLLGSHIVEKLIEQGKPVRVLVRETSDTSFLDTLDVEQVVGDVTDPDSLKAAMQGVEIVYHSAAQVGDWGPWERFVAVTIEGTRNMLNAARDANIKRFLHISSISTYGHPNEEGLVLDESAPLGSLGENLHKWSYYSRAKVEAEKLVWEYHNRGDIVATVVKPSWLYGERDRASLPRLITAIRKGKAKILGDGQNLLNLTYAGNEAEGCILAAESEQAAGEIYNLSSDGKITLEEYMNKIAKAIGCPPVKKHVPYGIAYRVAFLMECFGHLFGMKKPPLVTRYSVWLMGRRCFFSPEKARKELGWEPTVDYDEGIRRSVEWVDKNMSLD